MDKRQLLERAAANIYSTGLDDSGARLGLANMKYGLAKIHLAQEAFGFKPDATFIAAPDVTITRNTTRWKSGFGYGGLLTWGNGQRELIVLDLKPNCCGMLVGGLEKLPSQSRILQRAQIIHNEDHRIDGIPIQWDFGISNHFISVFRVTSLDGTSYSPFALIIHGSGSELRKPTKLGDGLYWDLSEELQRKAEVFDTQFGPLRLLIGQAANEYYTFVERANTFSQKRRLLVANLLVDDITLYSNENHQGLVSMNQMGLGIYVVQDTEIILPITLQARSSAYLARVRPNLTDEVIKRLGLEEQARRHGRYNQLRTANILPHGGGYTFPDIRDVLSVIDMGQERYFELILNHENGRQIVNNVRDLAFAYRGKEVVDRVVELGLGELTARLDPIYSIKL